jgi:hypothetical protein
MKKISFQFPATLLAFLSALWVKAVYPASSGMADTDFYWHLAYGRWIVGHQEIPSADFFSWTFAGQPYQLTQWLGEAAMGLAYGQWGLDGTKLLSVLLAGITIGFAWAGAKRFVHSSAALCLALMCNLVQIVAPMRPQLFSFALLSVSAYLVVSYAETRRLRFLGVFPFAMALWANLHGGFVVGLAIIGLAAVGISAEAHFAGKLKASASELMAVWGIVAASTLATLLNPYGIGAIRAVLMIGGLRSASVISFRMDARQCRHRTGMVLPAEPCSFRCPDGCLELPPPSRARADGRVFPYFWDVGEQASTDVRGRDGSALRRAARPYGAVPQHAGTACRS